MIDLKPAVRTEVVSSELLDELLVAAPAAFAALLGRGAREFARKVGDVVVHLERASVTKRRFREAIVHRTHNVNAAFVYAQDNVVRESWT